MRKILFFLTLVSCLPPVKVLAQAIDPQYIFVRKNPMACVPDCSYNWNFDTPQNINDVSVMDVINTVGTRGNDQRKLGIGVEINYNHTYDFGHIKLSLQNLLAESEKNTIPVFINLSGYQWWGDVNYPNLNGRPDLWNWWDTSLTGYNSDNKNNVEWTCWDNSCATKNAWRDWGGGEFEVRPSPNLASRAFIDGSKVRLAELVPIIVNWYRALPFDKKWLLGGVSNGTEIDIGVNYRVYSDGKAHNNLIQSLPIGYAAVKTAGIRSSGAAPTSAEIDEVIRRYLNELDKFVFDAGIPRHKIFNHTLGSDIMPDLLPTTPHLSTSGSAVTSYGNPGWSFYGSVANNPQNSTPLKTTLDKLTNEEWASPEWLPSTGYSVWITALNGALNLHNNRMINIGNWENDQVRGNSEDLRALKTVLNQAPTCWVGAPTMQGVTLDGNTVTLTWQKGTNNQAIYLNISSVGDFNTTGTFNTVDVANNDVTNLTNWIRSNLKNGKYYWELIADGCTNQRKIADGMFEVLTPTPTIVVFNCNRCATTNGCERAQFKSLTSDCVQPISGSNVTRITDCSCPKISGGDNSRCTAVCIPSVTPTLTPKPGDITGPNGIPDGVVDVLDYNKILTEFVGHPYTIFDYNLVVGNWGR